MGGVKDKIVSLFKTNITKDNGKLLSTMSTEMEGNQGNQKLKKQFEDNIIKGERNLFRLIKGKRSNER